MRESSQAVKGCNAKLSRRIAMTTKAYILIETAAGKSRDVLKALRSVQPVETVEAVTGPYDIIAVVIAPDLNVIGDLIPSRIHTINGVARTLTCFVLNRS